ncbi:MAG TPA: DUF4419 domain-containing protein [Candidatus Polarisedimenticolia bacterium]|nr:DUF4419 domain-containing protein [Candidatus Polarisedimenticolia bacterium]
MLQKQGDDRFWKAIYKPQKSYAAELASGWIAELFPYLFWRAAGLETQGKRTLCGAAARRNHAVSAPREDWLLPAPRSPTAGNGVNLKNFPSGLSRAPVKLTLPDGAQTQLELLGVSQRAEDTALAPVVKLGRGP